VRGDEANRDAQKKRGKEQCKQVMREERHEREEEALRKEAASMRASTRDANDKIADDGRARSDMARMIC